MKKLITFCSFIVLINTISFSQGCLPQGHNFSTQEEIDNFQSDYPGCTEIEGWVTITGHMTNLNGLSVLNSIGGDYLEISECDSLTNLTGLEGLTSIGGSLVVYRNNALTNFTGLEGLTTIGGSLEIWGNDSLTSLSGLEGLTDIGGYLAIGLNDLVIQGNQSLTSLDGLSNLTSVGTKLEVLGNPSLTNLSGLDNIDAESIESIFIGGNELLSTCEVKSICDYLSAPGASVIIGGNAPGCNSQQEVEDACEAANVDEIEFKYEFIIYPNPAINEIFIESKNGLRIDEVIIYNQLGQTVLHRNEIIENIDISSLGQGIYIIELTSNELKIRHKLIIEK